MTFDAEASLAAAVDSYNRADAEREIARRSLHSAQDVAARALAGRHREHAVCGTSGGYQKHHALGQEIDAACLEAHARDARRAKAARRARTRRGRAA